MMIYNDILAETKFFDIEPPNYVKIEITVNDNKKNPQSLLQ